MPNLVNLNQHNEDDDVPLDEKDNKRKTYEPRKENRESAQDKVDNAVKQVGLTPGQQRLLHDFLGEDNIPYEEIVEKAETVKRNYPNK